MSVRKRRWTTRTGEAKEAWIVDYTDQHGNRHIETFQRKKEADAHEAKVRIEVGGGTHVAPSDSMTVAAAADLWLKRVEADGRERATLKGYQEHVKLHIVPRIGRVKLAKLSSHSVEAFRDRLVAELSRHTARTVLRSFKMLLKAARYAHVAADTRIAPSKRERRLEPGTDFPTTGEIKALLAAAITERQRALLLTVALTGLRASELRGLRWADVDLKAAELHVRQRADRYNVIGSPKSEAGSRTVPLAPELVSALKTWKLACPISTADLVFPTSTGEIEYHANILRELHALQRAAGVVERDTDKPKYGLHAFRHFFASWCINSKKRGGRELPAKEVQHLLGHSSIVMTLDTYGHLFPQNCDCSELAAASSALLA